MIFEHRETGKCGIFVYPYDPNSNNQDDPCFHRIREAQDLPDFEFPLSDLHMPPEIYEGQGKHGLRCYLSAFFMDGVFDLKDPVKKKKLEKEARAAEKDFTLLICPSGFPDRHVPGIGKYDEYGNMIEAD